MHEPAVMGLAKPAPDAMHEWSQPMHGPDLYGSYGAVFALFS
jgi:hypothetical protein